MTGQLTFSEQHAQTVIQMGQVLLVYQVGHLTVFMFGTGSTMYHLFLNIQASSLSDEDSEASMRDDLFLDG